MSRVEPERNRYVGHRYVPKIFGEWDKQNEYEGLSIVTHEGGSYTSKKRVPVGIDILNEEFWVVTGNYNAQVEEYRKEVRDLSKEVDNKSDQTYVDTELGKKADKTYVDTELGKKSNQTYVDNKFSNVEKSIEDIESELDPTYILDVFKVPSDFNTLQSAVDYASRKMKGVKVRILIESGFRPSKGITVSDGDYSNISIESEDSVVKVSPTFTGGMMYGENCAMPKLMTVFDMDNLGEDGYSLIDGGRGYIASSCGVINAGKCCLYVRSSILRCAYGKFSGGNDRCAWFTRQAMVSAGNSDFSNCKGGNVAVYVSRGSVVEIANANISNARVAMAALYVVRSKVTALDTNISNSSANGVFAAQSSEVSLRRSDVTHAGQYAIQANSGSRIDLSSETNLSNAKSDGIHCSGASQVDGDDVIINDVGRTAAFAEENSKINIPNATILRPGRFGIWANKTSIINANNSVITSPGDNGVLADDGSIVNVRAANISNAGNHGVQAQNTGIINALQTKIFDSTKAGAYASSMSQINCRLATVQRSGTDDLVIHFGSTILGNETNTTADTGSPMYVDCNVSEFNKVLPNGILYV